EVLELVICGRDGQVVSLEERLSVPKSRLHLSGVHAAIDIGADLDGIQRTREEVRVADVGVDLEHVLRPVRLDERANHENYISGRRLRGEISGKNLLQ